MNKINFNKETLGTDNLRLKVPRRESKIKSYSIYQHYIQDLCNFTGNEVCFIKDIDKILFDGRTLEKNKFLKNEIFLDNNI